VARADIHRLEPQALIAGGRLVVSGSGFDVRPDHLPEVRLDTAVAHVVRASSRQLVVEVPADLAGGRLALSVEGLEGATAFVSVGRVLTSGVHQVDSPVYDAQGRLYATLSGQRGQETPVSVFRIGLDGAREPFVTGLGNATSLAFGPDGALYVSSRFEGIVSRVREDGTVEKFADGLGVAFGLAFNRQGDLFVGDRSGSIHRVDPDGRASVFATLPPSVAAFHLAMAPDDTLVVSAPTLNSCDALYRISPAGDVTRWVDGFGRPQGLAFDTQGVLHVVDALAGDSGVYRLSSDGQRTLVVAGAGLLGVAFDPTDGTMTVCSDDTIYRIDMTAGTAARADGQGAP
jgi:sugar lactone lactonase YvrE